MTGPEHYLAAEEILADAHKVKSTMAAEGDWEPLEVAAALQARYAEAQVHATLALAAATAANDPDPNGNGQNGAVSNEWAATIAPKVAAT